MGAVVRVARGLLPQLLGSALLIALVMGTAGGLATGLASGGLRARTAVERLIERTHLPDVMLSDPTLEVAQVDEIRELPEVHGAALLTGFGLFDPDGPYVNVTASVDGRYGVDLDVPNIVRGRAAAPDAADEVVLTEKVAQALGVDVGGVIHFKSYSPEQVAGWGDGPTDEDLAVFRGPDIDVEVVGISRHPADLTSDDPLSYFVALPSGFYDEYHGRVGEYFRFAMLDVGPSPTPAEEGVVAAAAQRIGGPDAVFDEAGEQAGGPLISTLDFVALAMVVLAVAIAVAGLIVGGLLVSRTVARAAFESAPLVALGMTNTGRATAMTVAFAPAALVAGVLTAVITAGSTAFLPFGLARRADPNSGFHLDLRSVALGVVATVVAVVVMASALAFREVNHRHVARARRNGTVDRLARAGLPVGPLVGVDLAVGSGRPGPAGGNQFAAAAVALASAAGIGALVLSASITHLESTPAAYGWTWDYVVPDDAAEPLAGDPAVDMVGVVSTGVVSLDGRPVVVRGMESIKGPPPVLVVDGRPPGIGEIVLGRRTMDDLAVEIGDEVLADGSEGSLRLRVVGEAVFAGIIDVPEASWGAAVQASDFEQLGAGSEAGSGTVVGLADGADREAFARRLGTDVGELHSAPEAPIELARLREIEALPWILTGFLGVVGLVAVVNAVVTTARRRARHLAVLRSIGLAPASVRLAVTVQSMVLAVMGLVVGVPLGLVIGPVLWRALAGSLGVVVVVDVPWSAVVASTLAGIAVAAVLALVPARAAARRSIAAALRTE